MNQNLTYDRNPAGQQRAMCCTFRLSPLAASMFSTKNTSPYPVASGRIREPPNDILPANSHSAFV